MNHPPPTSPTTPHQQLAGNRPVACAVITCSDSRTQDNDVSGRRMKELLAAAGHPVVFYAISKDDPAQIRSLLTELAARTDVQAILLNGGTGVSPRDNTFDTVSGMLAKTLPGFGEIFRMLSYEAIGASAMLSRATAGILLPPAGAGGTAKVVFSTPGSPNAVELAMTRLIVPELSHLAWELTRG